MMIMMMYHLISIDDIPSFDRNESFAQNPFGKSVGMSQCHSAPPEKIRRYDI